MPMNFLHPGEKGVIRKIKGAADTKRFLAGLGFVDGTEIRVVSELAGNLIVNVRDSRVAINREMAKLIWV